MSKRTAKMEEDVRAVIAACKADRGCPFSNFQLKASHFTFDYKQDGGGIRQYAFSMSDDYPDHTVMTRSDNPDDSKIISLRIPVLFNNLARELYTEMSITYKPDSITVSSSDDDDDDTEMYEAQDTLDDLEDVGDGRPSVDRMVSVESGCTTDSWDDEYDYYNEDDVGLSGDEDNNMNHLLSQDMEMVKIVYGDTSINERLFGTIDDLDVELSVNMDFLQPEMAKAWKVKLNEPVTVRLHLSLSRYLDATEPKVEVFQPSQKEKFGIGSQLKKIVENFIQHNWKKLSNDYVSNAYGREQLNKLKRQTSAPPASKKKVTSPSSSSTAPTSFQGMQVTHPPVDDHNIAQIVDMGFTAEMAKNALIITRGNFEESLNLLISSPETCTGVLADNKINVSMSSELKVTLPPAPPPRPKRQTSTNKKGKRTGRQLSGGACAAASTSDDLNLLPSTTTIGKNAKKLPSLENGFLVQVMQYVRQRLPTLNEFCVVCDEPHVFQNGAMLKPAVCARELCVFAFQTLGVMSDAADDIATGAEVVDLLIQMARTACKSSRKELIFDPFPTIIDPSNPTELALHPKKKDFVRAESAIDAFISIQKMTTVGSAELKKQLDRIDNLAYPLLQWIITSNRSHIVKLPQEKQISFMHTPHQFLLMSSPPAKEEAFKTAKKIHGSTFAFHGSNIENWHSIMRMGLINASGTKHQMHGAAYGKGIYLSPHSSVSFGYSRMGTNSKSSAPSGKSRFLRSKDLTCIALCEVITHKDLRKNGNIWVSPDPDHVCTRFFFVYEDGQVGDNNIDTQNDKYRKEILRAVTFQAV